MTILASIFRIALESLGANKLRSGLTLLGIIFGVTSVMTILSALEGAQASIKEDIERLGPSTFMVGKMMIALSEEEYLEKVKRKPISIATAEQVADDCVLCDKVSPRFFNRANVKYGRESMRRVGIMAGTANYIDIVDIEVAQGRFHSTEDDLYRRKVAFIGDKVRETFFEGIDAIGKTIKIGPYKYTIIGIAKKRGSLFGDSQDSFAIIPFSTAVGQFGVPHRRGIYMTVKAVSVDRLEEAMDEVRGIMRAARKVPYNTPDDFDMLTADSFMELFNAFTRIFRLSLIGISAISLVIGGIVVMNIMMVSVSERTREIGIRKSLGARHNHILLQFLFESVLLTLSGGLVGTALGHVIAVILAAQIDLDIDPSMLAITAGLSVSTGIGLIFGIYPALKAARLDPVKALSYE